MVLMHDALSECALKCTKFRCNIFDGYQVIEQVRFCDRQTHKQRQGGNIHTRVMVLVHDTSSECMKFR